MDNEAGSDVTYVEATVNGRRRRLPTRPNQTLIELLRNELNLRGTVEGCGVGVCGSCTVLLDGAPVSSCLLLARNIAGREVTSIEALAADGEMDPVQEAFIRFQAFQCGYCTPGFILATKALLAENPNPSREQVLDYLSGNLCRCGAYLEILRAVESLIPARESDTPV